MIKARKIGSFLILFFKSFSNLQNGSIGKGFAYLACTNAVMVFVGAVLVVVSLFAPIELSKMFISFKTIFQLSSIISKNHNFERNICTVMSNNQRTTREINTQQGVPSHHTPPKHPTSTKPPHTQKQPLHTKIHNTFKQPPQPPKAHTTSNNHHNHQKFIHPMAMGGGAPEIIAFLNGIRIHEILTVKNLVTKFSANILAVGTGLPAAIQGPLITYGWGMGCEKGVV